MIGRDTAGNAVLAVEVEARRGVDRDWAARLRRNLHAHGSHVSADFFMILTTDDVYLWHERGDHDRLELRLPDGRFWLSPDCTRLCAALRWRSSLREEALRRVKLRSRACLHTVFARSAREDVERLERFYLRLVDAAILAPLTPDVVRRSFGLRADFDLSAQDAFVLASVVLHLEGNPSEAAFATKNSKDFDDPGVRGYLEERTCRLLTSFGEAVGFAVHDA